MKNITGITGVAPVKGSSIIFIQTHFGQGLLPVHKTEVPTMRSSVDL